MPYRIDCRTQQLEKSETYNIDLDREDLEKSEDEILDEVRSYVAADIGCSRGDLVLEIQSRDEERLTVRASWRLDIVPIEE